MPSSCIREENFVTLRPTIIFRSVGGSDISRINIGLMSTSSTIGFDTLRSPPQIPQASAIWYIRCVAGIHVPLPTSENCAFRFCESYETSVMSTSYSSGSSLIASMLTYTVLSPPLASSARLIASALPSI